MAPPETTTLRAARALTAHAFRAEQSGAAVAAGRTCSAFEAAAVQRPIPFESVIAAEGRATLGRALGIRGAPATEGDVAAALTAANRGTDPVGAIQPPTTLRPDRAASALVTAAVECTVAGDAIVGAEDSAAGLAALAGRRALAAKPDGPARSFTAGAGAVEAHQTAAADDVPVARAASVVAAIERPIGVDTVGRADRGPGRLAALPRLRARGPESQTAGGVVGADTVDAIEPVAAVRAVSRVDTDAALVAAAIQGAVAIVPIVATDPRSVCLTALLGRSAGRTRSETAGRRRRRLGRGASTGAVGAGEVSAALDVSGAGAARVATAVARAIVRDSVARADDRPARLAALAGRGALGAKPETAATSAPTAGTIGAYRAPAAVEIGRAGAARVTAAVELAVPSDAVVAADDASSRLATFRIRTEPRTLPPQRDGVLRNGDARSGGA